MKRYADMVAEDRLIAEQWEKSMKSKKWDLTLLERNLIKNI